uniref:Peroxidase n=1 Tax=Leersia perrieri TaxID=77586 RepID=A0A0D9WZQ6_9ORYZ
MAAIFVALVAAAALICSRSVQAQLKVGYYRDTCNGAEETVRQEVASVLSVEPRLAGALLRLHFHDCFVRGCDGSILLDSLAGGAVAEKEAETSAGLRGFDVIDSIKEKLEQACPGTVSCADILALVARDAVYLSNGPFWPVPTGRLDGKISNAAETSDLPPPNSDMSQLQAAFAVKNLTAKDLVVLSGAHTIGFSHCQPFHDRLYNFTGGHRLNDVDPELDAAYIGELRSKCGAAADADPGMMVEMSPKKSPKFDTGYYMQVARRRGLFRSDAVLLADEFTRGYVEKHATGLFDMEFFGDFGEAMVNMGNLRPTPGSEGEVRRKCSVVN